MTVSGPHVAVVGTGTGVGKTVLTAGLVGALRRRGEDARAIKPCQTGHPPDDDAAVVSRASGSDAAAVCLRRLEAPLAPAVAADRAGVELGYGEILAGCEDALAGANRGVLEGIGGLRVPLADGKEVVDLVGDLGLPAVVVARSGLGTLNHTALTVEALRSRGIPVLGIVLNDYAGETVAERTNPAVLEGMVDPPVRTLPELALDSPEEAVDAVCEGGLVSLLPDAAAD